MLKYILAWIPMLFIAIFNGAIREMWLVEYFGEAAAHQLSCATGIVLLGVFIWAIIRNWRPTSAATAITIGLIWLIMTIAFEFLFGFYVRGIPWSSLFHEYNLFAGRLWVLVLLWVTVAPYLFYRLENRRKMEPLSARESSERLAKLGGTERQLDTPRRRSAKNQ
jgi:hypothetical protein